MPECWACWMLCSRVFRNSPFQKLNWRNPPHISHNEKQTYKKKDNQVVLLQGKPPKRGFCLWNLYNVFRPHLELPKGWNATLIAPPYEYCFQASSGTSTLLEDLTIQIGLRNSKIGSTSWLEFPAHCRQISYLQLYPEFCPRLRCRAPYCCCWCYLCTAR